MFGTTKNVLKVTFILLLLCKAKVPDSKIIQKELREVRVHQGQPSIKVEKEMGKTELEKL